jgi:hypothetical protein
MAKLKKMYVIEANGASYLNRGLYVDIPSQ